MCGGGEGYGAYLRPGEGSNSARSPQFAAWVDAVVFVFSLEDEISFQTVYNYFLRLCSFRNASEVPMVLVGTQGEQACRVAGSGGSPGGQVRKPSYPSPPGADLAPVMVPQGQCHLLALCRPFPARSCHSFC